MSERLNTPRDAGFDRRTLLGAAGLAGLAAIAGRSGAGPVAPPAGPVGPTGVKLDDLNAAAARPAIDVRTLPSDDTGLPADHVISQPGSYELRADLIAKSRGIGIRIAASGVTINLNGFAIRGFSSRGISAGGDISAVAIVNGSFVDCATGIIANGPDLQGWAAEDLRFLNAAGSLGDGMRLSGSSIVRRCVFESIGDPVTVREGSLVESCVIRGSRRGIIAGSGSVVRACAVNASDDWGVDAGDESAIQDCAVTVCRSGIRAGEGSAVARCVAAGSTFGAGIQLGDGSIAVESVAADNRSSGFGLGRGGVARDCVARNNGGGFGLGDGGQIGGCTAAGNANAGLSVGASCLVRDCTADENGDDGIRGGINCIVRDCAARSNGRYGISLTESGLVEGCTLNNNSSGGILVNNRSVVRGNVVDFHVSSAAAGISASGDLNRIEDNTVLRSTFRFRSLGANNLFLRNSFDGPGSNAFQNVTPGSTFTWSAAGSGATGPHVNFEM